ncbi:MULTISPECIES: hypothetical protein [unclassified Pseudomonas]|uniref:hypothetical protein n=1 Tax=unclassified Pseudomonas TaxID=196821 RepID=UPI00235E1DDE|nr:MULTISPECIES: hypothetical protein [unclassified Pseudomonas]
MNQRITLLAQAIAADVKSLKASVGDLTGLSTTAKSNLVAAINELRGMITANAAVIDDTKGNGDTGFTWSADKIYDTIEAAKAAVKSDILGGADAAYDTLKELQDIIKADETTAAALATAVNNRVRFDDAQTLTQAQKAQACANIGIGDPDTDFAAAYATAKA